MSSRTAHDGGIVTQSGSLGARGTRANSYPPLPHGSIYASGSLFESPNPFEPGLHKFSLIESALLVFSAAASFVITVFILLFVGL